MFVFIYGGMFHEFEWGLFVFCLVCFPCQQNKCDHFHWPNGEDIHVGQLAYDV